MSYRKQDFFKNPARIYTAFFSKVKKLFNKNNP